MLWHTIGKMRERRFLILKYMQKTPSLATCEGCHVKFFTPLDLMGESRKAEEHLLDKFASHKCKPGFFAEEAGIAEPDH